MFYLIGGAPRSGKTTIAKALSEKLRIPWISTDTLESVVIQYTPRSDFNNLFPKNVLRKITHQSNDEMYTTYTAEQIVDAYLRQGKSLERAIEVFIENESLYDHDYILEGYHIYSSLISKLEERFKIKSLFVGREDVLETVQAITTNSGQNDWVITKTKDSKTYPLIANMIILFSARLKQVAEQNNRLYFSIEKDFKETVNRIVESL